MKAQLILENGMIFEGKAFGATSDCVGEVVFNTGMTGYQEILTDPSYYGQIVTMTYPLIGNYGINLEDLESQGIMAKGLIVREVCEVSSNFRTEMELDNFLKQHGVMGLTDVDTRALTRIIRLRGAMKGIITTRTLEQNEIESFFKGYDNHDAVYKVSVKAPVKYGHGAGKRVAVMDYGIKCNILRSLEMRGCDITVYPANTKAVEVLKDDPDLVFLSNGPGDPADLDEIVGEVSALIGEVPVVGICLGHQLIGRAMGGKTSKLRFGHRGCNHPVKDLRTNRVTITSQNHGYHVSTLPEGFSVTHISMNDQTVEGMRHRQLPVYSVQFHPEASPGPVDNDYLFDEFISYAK